MLLCTAKEVHLEQTALNHYYYTDIFSYLFYSLSRGVANAHAKLDQGVQESQY